MKILFDHTIFLHQNYGGISRYIISLNNYLNKQKINSKIFSPIIISKLLKKKNSFFIIKLNNIPIFCRKIFYFINNFLSLIYFYVSKSNFFHLTYYNNFFKIFKIPYVMTVYDLTHEATNRHTQNLDKKRLLDDSKIIFCISYATKKDLLKFYKIKKSKIKVVHLGVSQEIVYEKNKKKYLLFVGERSDYKNMKNFLLAYKSSQFMKKHYKIVIFGGKKLSKEEVSFLKINKIQNKVVHQTGDDEKLNNYYKHASLFVFPSIKEGFGLPILEAMRFGCPVACSNINVFREIGGDSCFYFNPKKINDIKLKLEKILKSKNLKKKNIIRGFKHIKKFTWEKCAKDTAKVYKKIT